MLALRSMQAAGAAGIPVLNQVSATASAAYSLRKLRSAYAGSAINVRRSSDNTTQDIGFTASGDLNTTALLSFVGSGNGYVTTWYDQSGNAYNATQATAANQPMIVSSGTLQTINSSKPSVNFVASSVNYLTLPLAAAPSGTAAGTTNGVVDLTPVVSANSFYFGQGALATAQARYQGYLNSGTPTGWDVADYGVDTTYTSSLRTVVQTGIYSSANMYNRLNGTQVATAAASFNTAASGNPSIGALNAQYNWNGHVAELVIFASSLSTNDLHTLERNQGSYYGITVA